MLKLLIIVGTRPEIIRLSATIRLAKELFDVKLVHTGQNYDYELNDIFFRDLMLDQPDIYLECKRGNIGETVGSVISKSFDLFQKENPDAILILGDTNSCLCAYSAKRLKIPIFHLEAGNRCFDENVPEEVNRKIIDHLADVNVCYMEHARQNMITEGIHPRFLFVFGSPMTEIAKNICYKSSQVIEDMKIEPYKYIVVSAHREENISLSKNLPKVVECIQELATNFPKVVMTLHPRTRNMFEEKKIEFPDNVILAKPFGYIDYVHLQRSSYCVVSDSGTLTEESAIMNFPAVLLRTSTEHPEGVDSGNIVIGSLDKNQLVAKVRLAAKSRLISDGGIFESNIVVNYQDNNFSEKVCKLIAGYTNLVNEIIWRK